VLYLGFFIGYFLGSIPFGFLVAKAKGVNILTEGSGNPGATNVKRVLGAKWGNLVFFLDFFKGLLPILLYKIYCQAYHDSTHNVDVVLLMGLIIGHSYSIFLKFRGGKGVATTIGGLFIIVPKVVLLGTILWCGIFIFTHFVSLASLCFALSLPLSAYLLDDSKEIIGLTFFLTIIIFFRHIPNIRRLLKGTEFRFNK
jgi:glycerol-3-phosphate acyltransferase PlsY